MKSTYKRTFQPTEEVIYKRSSIYLDINSTSSIHIKEVHKSVKFKGKKEEVQVRVFGLSLSLSFLWSSWVICWIEVLLLGGSKLWKCWVKYFAGRSKFWICWVKMLLMQGWRSRSKLLQGRVEFVVWVGLCLGWIVLAYLILTTEGRSLTRFSPR